MDDKKLIKKLVKWLEDDQTNNTRKDLEDKWERYLRLYDGNLEEKKDINSPFRANINVSMVEYFVDGLAVRLKHYLMGDEFSAKLYTTDQDKVKTLEMVNKFLDAVMTEEVKIKEIINEIVFRTVKIACITELGWDVKDKYVKSAGKYKKQKYERGDIDIVPLKDFWVPEDATSLENATRKTRRVWMSMDYMKSKNFTNLEKLKQYLKEKKSNDEQSEGESKNDGDIFMGVESVEIYRTTLETDIDGVSDKWIIHYHKESETILNKIKFVDLYGDLESQYQRFILKNDGTFWGRGCIQTLYHLQLMANDLINAIFNLTALKIAGVNFYEEGAFREDGAGDPIVNIFPGAINAVREGGLGKIRFDNFAGQPSMGWEAIEAIYSMAEKVMGLSSPQLGTPTDTKKTLGEISIVKGEGDLKHAAIFIDAETAFQQIIRGILRLYQDNMPPGKFDNLVNKSGDPIFPDGLKIEDIQGEYTHMVIGASGLDTEQIKKNNAFALLNIFGDQQNMPGLVDQKVLAKEIADVIDPVLKLKLFPEASEQEEMINETLQALLMLAMQGQGQVPGEIPGIEPGIEVVPQPTIENPRIIQ